MTAIQGIGIAPGRARGPAVLLSEVESTPIADPGDALDLVADELEALASGFDGEMQAVLIAQAAMARDPALATAAREAMAAGRPASEALRVAAEPFRLALSGARGEYQRERAGDIAEIVARAVRRVEGNAAAQRTPPVPGILVSATVSPADTATVPLSHLLGVVSAEGGAKSHVAIVARSLGIPAVSGVDPAQLAEFAPGQGIEIDGTTGTIQMTAGVPVPSSRPTFNGDSPVPAAGPVAAEPRPEFAGLRANVGSVAEAELAAKLGLRSAGLVRTEFLLPDQDAFDIDRQVELYRAVLDRLPGEVVFRLLDIGADKPHPGLPMIESPNPALGLRGARLLLRHPELLEGQVQALCRLGEPERVLVLIPMITRVEEMREIRRRVQPIFGREGVELKVGAMIEVPAAALAAAELASQSDFLSIGTNDLLQYLFAADRGLTELDSLIEPVPPTTWQLLRSVIRAAKDREVPVGVCGELAAEPDAAGALLALGADYVSVGPAAASSVGPGLLTKSSEQWRGLARQLCGD